MHISRKTSNPSPRLKANILSKIFLWWMKDFLWTGWRRDLEQGDLHDVLKENTSSRLGDLLETYWNQELAVSKEKGKEPSLLRALFKAFLTQYLFSGFLTLLVFAVFRIVQPLLLQKVIEFFTPNNAMNQKEALLYGAALIVNGVVMAVCMHHAVLTAGILGMRLRIACCSLVYRKVMKLSKTSSEKTTTGYLVNLMSNDVNRFDTVTQFLHSLWICPMPVLLVMYCLWLYVDVSAFVGVGFIFLQTIPVQSFISKCLAEFRVKVAQRTDERVRFMSEIVSGIQVIKMCAWEKPFANLVAMARKYEMSVVKKASYLRGVNLSFMVFTERTSLYCTLLSYYLFGNIITADKVYAMAQFYNVLNVIFAIYIPNALTNGAETRISIRRIQEFLMQEELPLPENITKIEKKEDKRSPVGVTILNGRAKWLSSQAEDTLHNIFLHVKPGTLCAIIGPVGSGKSSLLHAILRELPLDSGFLETDQIAYASQEPWLFVGSVRQNILFGEPYDKRKYDEVVRVCALQRDLELFPYGDKTIVGERGVSLSGGQRARINLARAVYRRAEVYLLDDPLSAVDTHVGKHLFDMCIMSHLANKTRILVTHQLQYLKDTDMIVILNNGRIENQGTYSDILNSGLDFAKLLPHTNVEHDEPEVKPVSGSPSRLRQSSLKRMHSSTKIKRASTKIKHIITKRRHSSASARRPSIASTASSQVSSNDGFEPELVGETQSSGAVKWDIYFSYLRAGGNGVLMLAVALLVVVSQVSTSAVDYWSSIWTTIEEERLYYYYENNSTSAEATVEYVSDYVHLTSEQATIVYGILIVVCIVIVLMRSTVLFYFCMRASVKLHNTMFENILRAKMRFFDTNPSGRILNRFSKDIGAIDELLPRALIEVIQIFLVMIGILTMITIVNYMMIGPIIIIGSLFVVTRMIYVSTARSVKRLEGITRSPVFSHLAASINGLSTIRSCNAQEKVCKEFDDFQDRHTSSWYMFLSSSTAFSIWLDNFSNVFIAIITFTFLLSPEGLFGSGVGLALSQALILTGMVQYGVKMSTDVVSQITSVERVLEYTRLDKEPDLESAPDKKPSLTWPEKGCIIFSRLSLKYGENNPPVLKDLNFIVQPSHKVGIVGRTGAGKTSLISALYRLTHLEGTILIDGVDIQTVGLHDLRKRISIIPQEPVLFSASLRENLDPFNEFADDQLWAALEEVELKEAVGSLDFHVNEGGSNFSVGQRQLVCLARAILRNNRILVMDEATANVDPQTDGLIQATIRNKFKDCTVLTIAHRLNTIMDSDMVLVMDAGRMVEYDHPHHLLNNENGFFYKMVQETGPDTAQQLRVIAAKKYKTEQKQQDLEQQEEFIDTKL